MVLMLQQLRAVIPQMDGGFVFKKEKKYLSPVLMEFQPPGITKIDSPYYSEELANSTHILIQSPWSIIIHLHKLNDGGNKVDL